MEKKASAVATGPGTCGEIEAKIDRYEGRMGAWMGECEVAKKTVAKKAASEAAAAEEKAVKAAAENEAAAAENETAERATEERVATEVAAALKKAEGERLVAEAAAKAEEEWLAAKAAAAAAKAAKAKAAKAVEELLAEAAAAVAKDEELRKKQAAATATAHRAQVTHAEAALLKKKLDIRELAQGSVTELDISKRNLDANDAKVLSKYLKGNPDLSMLNISENRLLAKGVKLLAGVLKVTKGAHDRDTFDCTDREIFHRILHW